MRYSYTAALAPPVQSEAIYDQSLDRVDEVPNLEEIPQASVRVKWPRLAIAGRVPRRAPFGNPEHRSSTSQTTD